MGSLYRSEPMALCQLFLQDNSAFESVAELGELGVCQFRDVSYWGKWHKYYNLFYAQS
jgi:V-type H+-transporting ATPase subunit a